MCGDKYEIATKDSMKYIREEGKDTERERDTGRVCPFVSRKRTR